MTIGPEDPAVAGCDRLTAAHADREDVIETLKNAFVHGRLTKDELNLRVGQALAARTYADLAALTADIPPAPAAAGSARPPAPARRRPLARAAAKSGTCLIIAFPAFLVGSYFDPFGPWRAVMDVLAVCGLWTAVDIMGYALFTAWDQKSRRRQLPPRPGGQALQAEQCSGVGRVRFAPPPAPTRLAPTCGRVVHGSADSTFTPVRAGHMVASGRRQARYSAGETSTVPGASPVVPTGYYVSGRTRFPHERARKQAARQRAEPVLRKPESTGTQVRAKLARLRSRKRHHRESCPVLSSTTVPDRSGDAGYILSRLPSGYLRRAYPARAHGEEMSPA